MSTSHKFCLKSIISEKKQIKYKRKKKNLFVAKAIEAKAWLLLQVKIETKARFLAKRLASEATGDYANKKHFSAFFLFLRTSKKLTEEKNSSLIAKISGIRKRIER